VFGVGCLNEVSVQASGEGVQVKVSGSLKPIVTTGQAETVNVSWALPKLHALARVYRLAWVGEAITGLVPEVGEPLAKVLV